MSADTVLLLLGGGLVLIAIIGGGFEIKEVKIPQVGGIARILAGIIGTILIFVGIGLLNLSADANSSGNRLVGPVQGAPSFTISDHLGEGQVSEQIRVLINGRQVGTLTVNEHYPESSILVTVPSVGYHTYFIEATGKFRDEEEIFEASGVGQGTINVADKKHFELMANFSGDTWVVYMEESE